MLVNGDSIDSLRSFSKGYVLDGEDKEFQRANKRKKKGEKLSLNAF